MMDEFYRNFGFGMKKGADAPFSVEIAISSEFLMLLQLFSCQSPCQSMARRAVLMPEK